MKRTPLAILLLCLAAASAAQTPTKPAKKPVAPPPKATPTPGILSRIDPDVVEETDTYIIRRYPKDKYVKTDDRHIKHPNLAQPVEFFKEDDKYYYISHPKAIPGEKELKESMRTTPGATAAPGARTADDPSRPLSVGVTAADFEDLLPAREAGRLKLERVSASGLPNSGQWRASFVTADMNGDKKVDIVAPPARIGDGQLHVWLGDGKGAFSEWPLTFTVGGKPDKVSVDYGGVAAGDIDGDGRMDIVSASHGNGLFSAFGDGKGGFQVVRTGLPERDYSAQAIVLLDANGDGKLDIVASRDSTEVKKGEGVDRTQVRVYLFQGRDKGWEWKKDGIVGGFYSNSLNGWDYDGDGKKDVLTGSHYTGALTLLWKNAGDGTFLARPVRRDRAVLVPLRDGAGHDRQGTHAGLRRRLLDAGQRSGDSEGHRAVDLYLRERDLVQAARLAAEGVEVLPLRAGVRRPRQGRPRRPALRGQHRRRRCGSCSRSRTGPSSRRPRPRSPPSIRPARLSGWPTSMATGKRTLSCRKRWRLRTPRRRAGGMCT